MRADERGFYDSRGQWRRLYNKTWPSVPSRLAILTKPSEDSFPYKLKPRGWSRSSDPFTVEARKRLAEGTA